MKTTNTLSCPCGSSQLFTNCCRPYLMGDLLPETAEALMRSRYTAYSQANIEYIMQTMCGPAAQHFNPEQAREWAAAAEWQKLQVIKAWQVSAEKAFVEFVASYRLKQHPHLLHEVSEFHRVEGRWYYVTGITPKVSRNELCPCGSGKKAKRCCLS